MHVANFCAECGAHLKRKGLRAWLKSNLCEDCARRLGRNLSRPLILLAIVVIAAFALGRYLRPAPPPLVVQRAANSPLSDLPLNSSDQAKASRSKDENSQKSDDRQNLSSGSTDDVVYICGARTKKGTPCHRRVRFAGERCFQHRGMPAILPPEKLIVKP
jgi:hypothetical protein